MVLFVRSEKGAQERLKPTWIVPTRLNDKFTQTRTPSNQLSLKVSFKMCGSACTYFEKLPPTDPWFQLLSPDPLKAHNVGVRGHPVVIGER